MRPINKGPIAEPGPAEVEVAAADDATASGRPGAARCAIAPADRTPREPGDPGVRLRCFLDRRQEPIP
ncbi:DUF6207 family protein [Streptomyces sp. NPDC001928]|uniref:DUF6207 family protein n=1 Tax=Streptomyces sp. NPDC001928 TaxID=3154404 RepID=UPI00332F458C